MNEHDSLFATLKQDDGSFSPRTLPMYAGHFLAELESLFGPRDRSFTLLGIDVCETSNCPPHLWFPSTGVAPDDVTQRSSHIVIHLGPVALTDLTRARWQLAHECFHLLDPWNLRVDGRPTNMLEEGLATWYQNSRVPEAESHEGLYAAAEDLVRPLLGELPIMDELPNAVKLIRRERALRISEITPGILQDYCPGMSEDTSRKLCQPFSN